MVKVAIVYHSANGSTERIAHAIAAGARAEANEVRIMHCTKADLSYLDVADAIILGCPTYMGSVSAEFKAFMDSTSEAWSNRKWCDKIAAGFTNSAAASGDKLGTLQQLALFACQQGMIWLSLDLMAGKTLTKSGFPLNRLGGWLGLMTQINGSIDDPLAISDLATAEYFGGRIVKFAKKVKVNS